MAKMSSTVELAEEITRRKRRELAVNRALARYRLARGQIDRSLAAVKAAGARRDAAALELSRLGLTTREIASHVGQRHQNVHEFIQNARFAEQQRKLAEGGPGLRPGDVVQLARPAQAGVPVQVGMQGQVQGAYVHEGNWLASVWWGVGQAVELGTWPVPVASLELVNPF